MKKIVIENCNIQVAFEQAIGDLVEYIATNEDKVVAIMIPDHDNTRIADIMGACGASLDSFQVDSENGVPYRITFNKTRSKIVIGMMNENRPAIVGYTPDVLLCYNVTDGWEEFYKSYLPVCYSRASMLGIFVMTFSMGSMLESFVDNGSFTRKGQWQGL